jgi:hypothetical protein
MITDRHQEVLMYLQTVEQASLIEIYRAVPFSYPLNYERHLGKLLNELSEMNLVVQQKNGLLYKAVEKPKTSVPHNIPQQGTLFN